MDRARLNGLLRAYGPHLLLAGGFVKAIGVAAVAPFVGAPLWLALAAAALWVAGPAVAAYALRARFAHARPRSLRPTGVPEGADAPEAV